MASPSSSTTSIQQRIDALERDCITCDSTGCGQTNPRHRCSRCHMVYYCGRDCQKQHWKEHKADCAAGLLIQQRFGLGQEIAAATDNDNHAATAVNDECPICLASSLEKPVVLKACHHQFCFSCIKNWQQYQNSTTATSTSACPLCRKECTQTVQEEAMERARLLASRAYQLERRCRKNKNNNDNDALSKQQQAQECREKAIEELDRVLDGDPAPHLQALVTKAEIYSQNNQHQQALELYDKIMELDNQRHEKAAHLEQLLKRYEQAVALGQPIDETVEAQGNLDEAVQTMNRGALYESPWDDDHREEVLKLYEELKAELDATAT